MKTLPKQKDLDEMLLLDDEESIMFASKLGIQIPSIIDPKYYEAKPVLNLAKIGERFGFPETGEQFDSLIEAYDSKRSDEVIIKFDDSLIDGDSTVETFMNGMLAHNTGEHVRVLSGGINWKAHYLYMYATFLRKVQDYNENPDSIAKAWAVIVNHPAFWHKVGSKEETRVWACDEGDADLTFSIFSNEDGQARVILESGSYDPTSDYTCRFLDVALTVVENSADEAIIAFAKNVMKFHDLEGNSTKEADQVRDEWMTAKGLKKD